MFIHVIKIFPNPIFFKKERSKLCSRESFSISINSRNLAVLIQLLISIISENDLRLSPTNLFFTETVCQAKIKVGKTVFNLFQTALDNFFMSTFNNEITVQSVFYVSFKIASFLNVLDCSLSLGKTGRFCIPFKNEVRIS